MTPRLTVFRIFYSSTFTLLFLVLFALLLVTPSDLIARSRPHALTNIFTIAGGYILVLLLSLCLYIPRVVAARRSIAAIPRQTPLSFPSRVKDAIEANLLRSAEIAVQAQPRHDDVVHTGWDVPGGQLGGIEFVHVVDNLPIALGADLDQGTFRAWVEERTGGREQDMDGEVERFLMLYERARFRRRGKGIAPEEFRGLTEGFEKVVWRMQRETGDQGSVRTGDYTMASVERTTTGGTDGYRGAYGSLAGLSAGYGGGGVMLVPSISTEIPSSSHRGGYESDISRELTRSYTSDDTSTGGVRLATPRLGMKHRSNLRTSAGTFG